MAEDELSSGDGTDETEPQHASLSVEFGIRLIERLVTNGVLSREDAISVYKKTLESISDFEGNAAALRIAEAMARHSSRMS